MTFGLSKSERIKSKKEFALVYSSGKTIHSSSRKLKAIFLIKKSEESGTKAAFAVYKKAGSAVWRNRIKRLMRESYRLNKSIIVDQCNSKNIGLSVVFAVKSLNQKSNKKIFLAEIMPDIIDLMNQIKRRI